MPIAAGVCSSAISASCSEVPTFLAGGDCGSGAAAASAATSARQRAMRANERALAAVGISSGGGRPARTPKTFLCYKIAMIRLDTHDIQKNICILRGLWGDGSPPKVL